jgi:hypothetical protein
MHTSSASSNSNQDNLLSLTIQMLTQQILGNLFLPLVPITKQLFLIIQQLLVSFSGEFKVGSLHDGIDGAGLLALRVVDEKTRELIKQTHQRYYTKVHNASTNKNSQIRNKYTWSYQYHIS